MTKGNKENLPAPVPVSLRDGIMPKDFEELQRFAGLVQRAGLSPKSFDTVEKVAIGILTNMEMGRPIITGLQDLAVINGRCGIYGDAALAMITGSGLMEDGYPIEEETGQPFTDSWTFKFKVKRKGGPERVGTFSWPEAKRAGFDDPKQKDGRPDRFSPWRRFPRRMMMWKSRNWVLRDVFGDVLKGLKTVEDLHDLDGIPELTPDKTGAYSTEDLTTKLQDGAGNKTLKIDPDIMSKTVVGEEDKILHLDIDSASGEGIISKKIKMPDPVEERVPCPWPDCECNRLRSKWLKPGKGLSTHLTRQHGGQRPPVVLEVGEDETDPPPQDPIEDENLDSSQVDAQFPDEEPEEIPLFNDDGSLNPEAQPEPNTVAEMVEKIRRIDPEIKREAYRRVGLDTMNPVLSVFPESTVKEIFEMIRTVATEYAEGKY